jgi:hypothetical protein
MIAGEDLIVNAQNLLIFADFGNIRLLNVRTAIDGELGSPMNSHDRDPESVCDNKLVSYAHSMMNSSCVVCKRKKDG